MAKALSPEAAFAGLAPLGEVSPPSRGFGSGALKTNGKIFAALSGGKLLLKLPAPRVAALIDAGDAEPFFSGGRKMKEWALATPRAMERWPDLAAEAKIFVASGVVRARSTR